MGQLELYFVDHLVMFVLIFLLPAATLLGPKKPFADIEINTELKRALYLNNSAIQWAGVLVILAIWWFTGRDWRILGFQMYEPQAHPLWWALLILFIIFYLGDTLYKLFYPGQREKTIEKWEQNLPFVPSNYTELKWWVVAAVSAGICEEIIFRGYMINYLLSVFRDHDGAILFAITIPAIVFGIAHLYQGIPAVIKIVIMAILFGMIFILTKSLVILMIVHFLLDMVGGALGVWVHQSKDET